MPTDVRQLGSTAWNVWRAIVGGVLYLGAAIFNAVYTLPLSTEPGAFEGYADGAWFGFLADFIREIFEPNGVLFMAVVIIFELTVGFLILSRDRMVDLGITASLVWVILIIPFLAWPYVFVNVALAAAQGVVLVRRYDTSIWSLAKSARTPSQVPHPR